ncbi:hypothetical protein [Streptomyces sp900116325]|uniref:hypothetical protein n=1 Tax=Streptomyces sp. 900116325 TaxID=3154295 RepID=UPI0033C24D5C
MGGDDDCTASDRSARYADTSKLIADGAPRSADQRKLGGVVGGKRDRRSIMQRVDDGDDPVDRLSCAHRCAAFWRTNVW